MPIVRLVTLAVPPLLAVAAAAQDAAEMVRPVDRRFTFVEETLHGAAKGRHEVEQWVDWRRHSETDPGFDRFDFKTEAEYGLTDDLHAAVDVAEWHIEDSARADASRFDAVAFELKWRVLDPREGIGFGLKTELGIGPVGLEWENVAIVDRVVGRFEFAYNIAVEAGWEGERLFEFREADGGLRQAAGVSYEVQPSLCAGLEVQDDLPLPEWKTGQKHNLSLGPNLAWHGHDWALTTTAMWLAGGDDATPDFELRIVFEFDF